MNICNKLKCIFLHFNKSGGTSIEKALQKHSNLRSKSCDTVMSAKKLAGKKKWKDYYTFAIVRNPWDKMLSLWLYRINVEIPRDTTFEYFIKNVDTFHDPASPKEKRLVKYRTRSQWHSCVDKKGRVGLDYIGRFEELEKSWNHICKKLGKQIELRHFRKSKHDHYSKYYTEELKNIVAERFAEDIEHFGYKFESEAK